MYILIYLFSSLLEEVERGRVGGREKEICLSSVS